MLLARQQLLAHQMSKRSPYFLSIFETSMPRMNYIVIVRQGCGVGRAQTRHETFCRGAACAGTPGAACWFP